MSKDLKVDGPGGALPSPKTPKKTIKRRIEVDGEVSAEQRKQLLAKLKGQAPSAKGTIKRDALEEKQKSLERSSGQTTAASHAQTTAKTSFHKTPSIQQAKAALVVGTEPAVTLKNPVRLGPVTLPPAAIAQPSAVVLQSFADKLQSSPGAAFAAELAPANLEAGISMLRVLGGGDEVSNFDLILLLLTMKQKQWKLDKLLSSTTNQFQLIMKQLHADVTIMSNRLDRMEKILTVFTGMSSVPGQFDKLRKDLAKALLHGQAHAAEQESRRWSGPPTESTGSTPSAERMLRAGARTEIVGLAGTALAAGRDALAADAAVAAALRGVLPSAELSRLQSDAQRRRGDYNQALNRLGERGGLLRRARVESEVARRAEATAGSDVPAGVHPENLDARIAAIEGELQGPPPAQGQAAHDLRKVLGPLTAYRAAHQAMVTAGLALGRVQEEADAAATNSAAVRADVNARVRAINSEPRTSSPAQLRALARAETARATHETTSGTARLLRSSDHRIELLEADRAAQTDPVSGRALDDQLAGERTANGELRARLETELGPLRAIEERARALYDQQMGGEGTLSSGHGDAEAITRDWLRIDAAMGAYGAAMADPTSTPTSRRGAFEVVATALVGEPGSSASPPSGEYAVEVARQHTAGRTEAQIAGHMASWLTLRAVGVEELGNRVELGALGARSAEIDRRVGDIDTRAAAIDGRVGEIDDQLAGAALSPAARVALVTERAGFVGERGQLEAERADLSSDGGERGAIRRQQAALTAQAQDIARRKDIAERAFGMTSPADTSLWASWEGPEPTELTRLSALIQNTRAEAAALKNADAAVVESEARAAAAGLTEAERHHPDGITDPARRALARELLTRRSRREVAASTYDRISRQLQAGYAVYERRVGAWAPTTPLPGSPLRVGVPPGPLVAGETGASPAFAGRSVVSIDGASWTGAAASMDTVYNAALDAIPAPPAEASELMAPQAPGDVSSAEREARLNALYGERYGSPVPVALPASFRNLEGPRLIRQQELDRAAYAAWVGAGSPQGDFAAYRRSLVGPPPTARPVGPPATVSAFDANRVAAVNYAAILRTQLQPWRDQLELVGRSCWSVADAALGDSLGRVVADRRAAVQGPPPFSGLARDYPSAAELGASAAPAVRARAEAIASYFAAVDERDRHALEANARSHDPSDATQTARLAPALAVIGLRTERRQAIASARAARDNLGAELRARTPPGDPAVDANYRQLETEYQRAVAAEVEAEAELSAARPEARERPAPAQATSISAGFWSKAFEVTLGVATLGAKGLDGFSETYTQGVRSAARDLSARAEEIGAQARAELQQANAHHGSEFRQLMATIRALAEASAGGKR